MKILFVENRQQTLFWEKVAEGLAAMGHEIHWIVQNHAFTPECGRVHTIPYPTAADFTAAASERATRVMASDRNINYFKGGREHYRYYEEQIQAILERVSPDVAFGESTLFHELLTVDLCRTSGVLYLQPTSCRYPLGRFSFFLYDTLHTFAGSGDTLATADALRLAQQIGARAVQPDYMRPPTPTFRTRLRALGQRTHILRAYLGGEHYNTPSPLVKWSLERDLAAQKRGWEALASERQIPDAAFRVMYPLQMQPESTIDVWGYPYSDQVALLQQMLHATDERTVILVKPNPKSYYEMSAGLVALVKDSPRLIPLSHRCTMSETLPLSDLVVTVTGTVAIEAVCAGRPVATLIDSITNKVDGCYFLANPSSLGALVQTGPAAAGDPRQAGMRLLQLLQAQSYPGIISNPWYMPVCVSKDNLARVHQAFLHVLSAVQSRRTGHANRDEELVVSAVSSGRPGEMARPTDA